ncbi:copper resistance CopC family protein [Lysinibacter sp. HNR]|uniref:copper resistance CopC family protein n=1 Tax=Lysinibacter sp. HNR TaxID=3031408 RepID=UPI002434FAAE|nr:copper resistance CopC family protein [Lysinibacter sp. HNR]WGD37835.1 copper resistance protein CopC [Lysinibacter sp. HNR]
MLVRSVRRIAVGSLFVGLVAVTGFTLGLTSVANAHNYVVSTTPAEGSTITEQPDEIRVRTNDRILEAGAALVVQGPDGNYYNDGCAAVDGVSITGTASLGVPGTYTVIWALTSADGHPLSEEFTFDWAPADGVVQATGVPTLPVCGVEITDSDNPAISANSGEAQEANGEEGFPWGTVALIALVSLGAIAVGVLVMVRMGRSLKQPGPPITEPEDGKSSSGPQAPPEN